MEAALFVAVAGAVCAATARRPRAHVLSTAKPVARREGWLRVAGVMSGTSADAIDVAVCDVRAVRRRGDVQYDIKLVVFEEATWPEDVRTSILDVIHNPHKPTRLQRLGRLNFQLAHCFADAVLGVVDRAGLSGSIDAVACHGQTVFHDPPHSTSQIGDGSVIAARTGVTTVSNFRTADVAVGGQGAPLASTLDWFTLRLPRGSGWRAMQNIGGIGNVTFLPPIGSNAAPLAFDTGPGNCLIDMAAHRVDASLTCDIDGKLAMKGKVCKPLLEVMMRHPYVAKPAPKTTGRELYSADLFQQWWQLGTTSFGATGVDIVATMTEYTARTICDAYARFLPDGAVLQEVVVAGGGVRNPHLMARLRAAVEQLPRSRRHRVLRVCAHDEVTDIQSDAKEAMLFALLGAMAILGHPSNVPACTGARSSVVLGQICPAANYRTLLQQTAKQV